MSADVPQARPLVGFRNLGNTCFVNSALQVLFRSNILLTRLNSHAKARCSRRSCVTCAVVEDCKRTKSAKKRTRGIWDFEDFEDFEPPAPSPDATLAHLNKLMPEMVPGSQQDSHAFLLSLLNAMNEELANHRVLMGEHVHITACNNCKFQSEDPEPFWNIPVPVMQSIDASLDAYFASEDVSDEDKIDCRNCKQKSAVSRSLKLKDSPEILIIQLARFDFVEGMSRRVCDETRIPRELDLSKYRDALSPPRPVDRMRFVGMVTHLGESLNSGHYRAIVGTGGNRFHLFDDSVVRIEMATDAKQRDDVYFALYERAPEVPAGPTGTHPQQQPQAHPEPTAKPTARPTAMPTKLPSVMGKIPGVRSTKPYQQLPPVALPTTLTGAPEVTPGPTRTYPRQQPQEFPKPTASSTPIIPTIMEKFPVPIFKPDRKVSVGATAQSTQAGYKSALPTTTLARVSKVSQPSGSAEKTYPRQQPEEALPTTDTTTPTFPSNLTMAAPKKTYEKRPETIRSPTDTTTPTFPSNLTMAAPKKTYEKRPETIRSPTDTTPTTFPPTQHRFSLADPLRTYEKRLELIRSQTDTTPTAIRDSPADPLRTNEKRPDMMPWALETTLPRTASSSSSSSSLTRARKIAAVLDSSGTRGHWATPPCDDSVGAQHLTSGSGSQLVSSQSTPASPPCAPPGAPPQSPCSLHDVVARALRACRGGRSPLATPSPPEPKLSPKLTTPSPVKSKDPSCAPSPAAQWTSRSDPGASALRSTCRPVLSSTTLADPRSDSSEEESRDRLPAPTSCHEPVPVRHLKCEQCSDRFRDKRSLQRHMLKHSHIRLSDRRLFPCWFCTSTFRTAHSLHLHLKVHVDFTDSLQCPKTSCGFRYTNPDRLDRHLLAHKVTGKDREQRKQGAKPLTKPSKHKCRTCNARFDDCKSLRRHRTTLGERCRRQEECATCKRRRQRRQRENDIRERVVPWEAHKNYIMRTIGLW